MGSEPAETDAGPSTAALAKGSGAEPGPRLSASAAGGPTTTAAEPFVAQEVGLDQRPDVEFQIAVDVIYHRGRQAFLLWLHRAMMFVATIGGAVAVSDLFGTKWPALIASCAAASDLVGDFTGGAATHGAAVRELIGIMADLQKAEFSDEARAEATDKWIRQGADVPANYHVARDLAFNQTIVAFGRDTAYWANNPWWKRALAHVLRFEGAKPADLKRKTAET